MWRAFVLLPVALAGCANRPPLEATLRWENALCFAGPARAQTADSAGLIMISNDHCVQPIDERFQSTTRTWFLNRGTFAIGDIAGAPDPDHVWATCKRHDSLFILDFVGGREIFVAQGVDRAPQAGWDGTIGGVALRDIDADGRLEAVVTVGSGFDISGRGIYVLDWESGNLVWSLPMGPNPRQFLLRDVDNDGRIELLIGTQAAGNGCLAGGTDDSHTYAVLLDAGGSVRWIVPIGRYSSTLSLSWLADSAALYPPIFVAELGAHPGDRERDSVFVLDSRDGSVAARAAHGRFNNLQAVLSEKGRETVVLLGGDDDTLRVLDPRTLAVRGKRFVRGGITRYKVEQCVVGKDLAIVPTSDGRLTALAPSLQVLCDIPSGLTMAVYPISESPSLQFLALHPAAAGDYPLWQLYSLAPTPVLRRPVSVATLLGVLLAAIIAFGLVLATVRYGVTRDMRTVVRSLTGQSGVVEVNKRGQVRHTNPKARELLGGEMLPAGPLAQAVRTVLAEPPGSMPRELPVVLDGGKTVLARAARVRSGVMLTLEDISAVEYLQRVKAWAPVAQKLAHGIKNPLGTIMGAVEQIETKVEDDRVQKYVGYVKDEVTRLKKMTDAFMRFTKLNPPALQPVSVNELVRKVVAKYEGALAKGISLEMNLDDKLPLVALDEEGMANVLDIVIENAVEAMGPAVDSRQDTVDRKPETGDRVLRIRTAAEAVGSRQETADRVLRESGGSQPGAGTRSEVAGWGQSPAHEAPRSGTVPATSDMSRGSVRIEVEDTGAGIPEKYLYKVFEPYFTHGKPDGTGLGLALAKKIVEDHKGRMEIQSKEGTGTTVSIVLPIERRTDAG